MRHFGRGWRCITLGRARLSALRLPRRTRSSTARTSSTATPSPCSTPRGVDKAHVVGLSMGGYTGADAGRQVSRARHLLHGRRRGFGRAQGHARQFLAGRSVRAAAASSAAGKIDAEAMGLNPTRVQLQNKDPIGWRTFVAHLAEHPGARGRQDAAHRAGRARLALRPGGRAEGHQGAGAAAGRRRGRALPRREPVDEAADAERAARVPAGLRPCHQSGGAGAVQSADRAVHRRRGARQLARARRRRLERSAGEEAVHAHGTVRCATIAEADGCRCSLQRFRAAVRARGLPPFLAM